MEKTSTEVLDQKTKNSIPDKREYQLYRESKKTIYIILISLITFMILALFFLIFNQEIERKLNKNKPIQNKQDTVFVVKTTIQKIDKIDNTGLDIVLKVSKDYRKYFISYKSYYTPSKYLIKIEQITFEQFMTIQEGDTIHKAK